MISERFAGSCPLKIVADENIPFVREAFAGLGDVHLSGGRKIDAGMVRDADILLVRSITRVDHQLLEGSKVRFVATATIGTDHIDQAYLASRGIVFSAAPGSNAESVAEYIVAALLHLAQTRGFSLESRTIGVIGVGNVGSRVVRNAEALGMTVLMNDPPKARATQDPLLRTIEEVLEADIITLHVPLTRQGPDATRHLVNDQFLKKMKPGSILINSARGSVVDGAALLQALESGHIADAVLDVWEGEPAVSLPLLARTTIGTPHIAGYSFDGKVRATEMIRAAAGKCFGIEQTWDPASHMPAPLVPELRIETQGVSVQNVLAGVVAAVYDIMRDDAGLRAMLSESPDERAAHFDLLRKHYPARREFNNTRIILDIDEPVLAGSLRSLRFRVS